MKFLLRHIGDTGEYVGNPGARVNAIELCGLDLNVNGGGAFPAWRVHGALSPHPPLHHLYMQRRSR